MRLSDADIRRITQRIVDALHPERIILFGSYAAGTSTSESDLDLLVVMKTDAPRHQRSIPVRHLFWPPPAPMDIVVYTPEEVERWNGTCNHLITEAMSRGKVLYAA